MYKNKRRHTLLTVQFYIFYQHFLNWSSIVFPQINMSCVPFAIIILLDLSSAAAAKDGEKIELASK